MAEKQYDILETMHGCFQTTFSKKHLARKPWEPENPNHIKSNIPGTIVEVCVKEGQQVKAGDILIVFKAMKMNNNIRAALAGKVLKIDVKEGDNVPNHARDDRNGVTLAVIQYRDSAGLLEPGRIFMALRRLVLPACFV